MMNEEIFNLILMKKRYAASKSILMSFRNIDYSVIKGEPLSFQAYGGFGKRISSDIDILIPKSSLTIAEKILSESGYSSKMYSRNDRILMLTFSHQIAPWSKSIPPFGDVIIDLNFDLFWGEYTGRRIDIDTFLSDTIDMNICDVSVKTLPPLKAMIQLILHHYKEMNSIYHLARHNTINYCMFKDVYYLWKNNINEISLDELIYKCEQYEIMPYAFYILYYTNVVFKDTDLKKYVDAFQSFEGYSLLDYYGLAESERKLWKVDFQTRLSTENLYELIKDDLTEKDFEKLERNRRIFG